jgi:hypothetical protein
VSKVAAASTIAKTAATTPENRAKSLRIFFTLSHRTQLSLLGLDLLLLLERGLGLCRCDRRHEIIPLRQPQPDLRHVGKGQPRIAVSERGGRFEALLCPPPILVCPTHHCHSSPFVR